MTLPELSLQFLYARLGWALVLAALVVCLWPAGWRLPRGALGAIVAASLALMALPGTASPAWHLGLAFQYPSGLLAALCLVKLCGRWRAAADPGPAAALTEARAALPPALPVPLAALLGLTGLLLYLDAFGLIAGGYYYAGFGGRAALGAVLLAGVCALAATRAPGARMAARTRAQAGAILGALALFSFARLPSGNLWDALIDPLLWGWALTTLVRAALRALWPHRLRGGLRRFAPASAPASALETGQEPPALPAALPTERAKSISSMKE